MIRLRAILVYFLCMGISLSLDGAAAVACKPQQAKHDVISVVQLMKWELTKALAAGGLYRMGDIRGIQFLIEQYGCPILNPAPLADRGIRKHNRENPDSPFHRCLPIGSMPIVGIVPQGQGKFTLLYYNSDSLTLPPSDERRDIYQSFRYKDETDRLAYNKEHSTDFTVARRSTGIPNPYLRIQRKLPIGVPAARIPLGNGRYMHVEVVGHLVSGKIVGNSRIQCAITALSPEQLKKFAKPAVIVEGMDLLPSVFTFTLPTLKAELVPVVPVTNLKTEAAPEVPKREAVPVRLRRLPSRWRGSGIPGAPLNVEELSTQAPASNVRDTASNLRKPLSSLI